MSICNKDCFHCPYPDCINDDMDHEDYIEAAKRDLELRSTPEKRKVAAQQKAYRENNREKVAAQQKAYYKANREKLAAQKKAYRENNREKVAAQQKAYYKANREKLAAQQRIIRETRISVGLSQATAANILGVSRTTICFWENGNVPCDTAAVVLALRSAIQEKPPAELPKNSYGSTTILKIEEA